MVRSTDSIRMREMANSIELVRSRKKIKTMKIIQIIGRDKLDGVDQSEVNNQDRRSDTI